jgi:hypothetical protein
MTLLRAPHVALAALALILVAAGVGCRTASADPPGLRLLRPAARPGLERQLAVGSLDDLTRYEIDQALDEASGQLSGQATIRWTNTTGAPVSVLPLLLHPNAAAELGVAGAGGLTVTEVKVATGATVSHAVKRPTLLEVTFAPPLPPGARVALAVRYTGRLRTLAPSVNDVFGQALASMGTLAGNGAADYGLLAVGDGILTAASAYPMVAPHRAGAFDTAPPARFGDLAYNTVASFRVRTVLPAGMRAVTNLIDEPPRPAAGGGTLIVSAGTPVRDFVLVAGRDLVSTSAMVGSTRVVSTYRPRDARAGKIALEAAKGALASFERRFGPYPYRELDVVEASLMGGAGGVEFCGMVLIGAVLYRSPADSQSPLKMLMDLYGRMGSVLGEAGAAMAPPAKPEKPAAGGVQLEGMMDLQLEFTVDHEVAHQYFAGIVGNDSRRQPSLDEPLAQYLAGLAYADRHGAAAATRAMDLNVRLNYALYRLLGGVDAPVARDTTTFRTPLEYAALVYGKAPYLYQSLGRTFGEAKLHAAMRAVVARNRFGLMTTAEWRDALARESGGRGPEVQRAFRRWLDEAHGDEDLKVDDSGDLVMRELFPPEVQEALRGSLEMLGMKPRDLLRMLFGGAIGGGGPTGPALDVEGALKQLLGE